MTIWKYRQSGGHINRTSTTGYSFHNWRCDAFSALGNSWFNHSPQPGKPTDATFATRLLKETNPSRPVVDLPVFVAELRDFPRLLKLEGDTLIRRAGSANLSYHFGWAPLISDLGNLLSFSDQVAKRERELRDMHKSGLRRRRTLYRESFLSPFNSTINSLGLLVQASYQRTTLSETAGFVEWFPTTLPPSTPEAYRSLARRAVLGLTIDLATAWELIPFSWLIDWCSNVGDFLQANRNIVGARHGPVQIMHHMKTTSFWPGNSNVSRHDWELETKERRVLTPSLSAYLPFLSLRQLSILGSIGVTRRLPRNSL